MTMTWIWTGLLALAVLFGAVNGRMDAVSSAAVTGAADAVKLCVSMGGVICLWSGVMEVMKRSGLAEKLTNLLRPLLRRLFPRSCADGETGEALAENLSANLLGLGNAATPAGIRAVKGMQRAGSGERELSRLVVLNTASVQLVPTTVAAVRAAAGAQNAFDILPAVWISSAVSVCAGLLAERLFAHHRK